MSLGKMPAGIKGLVSGSQGKRRFKSELSVDMISPPLGDFRHTMHVGRGGDVFGDTSFLSNYGSAAEPGSPDSAGSSRTTGFFTRTFRHVGKNSGSRTRAGSRDLSSPPPDISPIIKNAISLPQLNIDAPNGCLERALFPSSMSAADGTFYTYGLPSGFVTLPRLPRLERQYQDAECRKPALTRSDSLTSFHVDLGPSLMTEVLSFFDNPPHRQSGVRGRDAVHEDEEDEEEEEEEEEQDSCSLMDTPTQSPAVTPPTSMGSSSFRRSRDSRGRCGSSSREREDEEDEEEGEEEEETSSRSSGTPRRKEPAMEAERFQRAADVLSRHYGGASITRRRRLSSDSASPDSSHSPKTSNTLSEEEEEIKV